MQSVKCTGCGAAVNVREHSACTFCHAPIAIIDPDQLQRTIASLQNPPNKDGRYEAEFGLGALPPGAYLVEIAASGGDEPLMVHWRLTNYQGFPPDTRAAAVRAATESIVERLQARIDRAARALQPRPGSAPTPA